MAVAAGSADSGRRRRARATRAKDCGRPREAAADRWLRRRGGVRAPNTPRRVLAAHRPEQSPAAAGRSQPAALCPMRLVRALIRLGDRPLLPMPIAACWPSRAAILARSLTALCRRATPAPLTLPASPRPSPAASGPDHARRHPSPTIAAPARPLPLLHQPCAAPR